MAEAVISTIAGKIVSILSSQAIERVGKLWGVKHELNALRDTVSMLQPVLDHAEEQYYQTPHIRAWVEELKDAFYEAQDVLEEFNIEAIRRELRGHNEMVKEVRTFFSSSNQLAFKLKMSNKVRAVRERIQAIKTDSGFHLDERHVDSQMESEWRKREETHSFIREGDIIRREDDKKSIIKFLLDSDVKEDVSVLPIVGLGGIGKTALAQWVYNDEMISKQFNLKMWVRVSDGLDVKKIAKSIVVCAKKKGRTTIAMGRLESELRAEIGGKRYLLVLDDLWDVDRETWLMLKTSLMGGARGSKILITTRSFPVAAIASAGSHHLLRGLSIDASLHLLLQMAGRKEEEIHDREMLEISQVIIKECYGVPLVVRTVGSLLFYRKSKLEWFPLIKLLRASESEDRIQSLLRLSYDLLPSHLKQCFAFCSLFPRYYEIKKQTLVNLWVAEGFIEQSNRSQHLEDIAHGYFMDLLFFNFFQDYEKDTETCKMHDLMHYLACLVAGTECWAAWHYKKSIPERTHHISHGLTSNWMDGLRISRLKENSLKTFRFAPTYREMEQREPTSEADLCQLIQSFKRLHVLDLHAVIIKKVPTSICKLKHLTCLDFSHNNALKRLPNSITSLQYLQTLNLQGCFSLEELPRDIGNLISLRNLDIDYCYNLNYVPCGLGRLTCLHRLTRFILPVGKKALAKNYSRLGELNGLNNILGNLSIENLEHSRTALVESSAANLIGKDSLESLILKWNYVGNALHGDTDEDLLDGLRPHSNLQKLTIHGYQGESFPRWIMDSLVSSLPNLVEVCLLRCGRCKRGPPLGQLRHLKSLEIWRLTELEYIESDHSSTSTASFPSLLKLDIQYCENLEAMPLSPHLEHLILRMVRREWISQLFGLNKLRSLDISQMEFLKCLPTECLQSLTSLERLSISECPQLTSLSLGMQHLSNLVHLSISNCEELNLSKDESGNILDLHGLVSLQFMDILGVPKLAYLPQWLLQVSNLRCLSIKKCLKLKALQEGIEALQSLERLDIVRCPLLTSLPEGMRRLASLSFLKIAGSPNLEDACQKDVGEDWYKIAHIPFITHELEYDERHL